MKNFPKKIIKDIFSIPNICGIVTIFCVFFLYYKINTFGSHISLYVPWCAFDTMRISTLFIFYVLNFGVYTVILYKENKKEKLYYGIIITLLLIPFIAFGGSSDFCMRASIPSMFIMMIYMLLFLNKALSSCDIILANKTRVIASIVCLTICATSFLFTYMQHTKEHLQKEEFPIYSDEIITWSDKKIGDVIWAENFICTEWEDSIFFRFFAK